MMRHPLIVLTVAIAFCVCHVFAIESIKVNMPRSLAAIYPDGIPERPAMFGVPSYASSLQGRLIWSTPGDRDGCAPVNKSAVTGGWPKSGSVILLMDRGECTFVTKVRNAEQAGAIAAIIVDNIDEAGLPFMADDSTGKNIAIPSALIHKNDGAVLKAALTNTSTSGIVVVTMSWSLPRPDNRVEYDLWSSAVDEMSRGFKNVFASAASALGEHAKYTPRYFVLNGDDYGCTDVGEPCGSQCTNGGRYCAVDPDHVLGSGLEGADVVHENLAQLCLYNYLNETNNDNAWWQYVSCFQTNCYPVPPAKNYWNDTCKNLCLASIGVAPDVISDCVATAGGYGNNVNTLLANEIDWRQRLGVFYLPTLFVNLTPYRGSLVCPVPLDMRCGPLAMICEGYQEGTRPAACSSSPGCAPGVYFDGCGVCGGSNSSCADCAGKPYGLAVTDSKGACCQAKELDCRNVCHGSTGDACGECRIPGDVGYMPIGEGSLDVCGTCLRFQHPAFNNSGCLGCDGAVRSGKTRDVCGLCGGTENDQSKCASASSISVGGVIGISVGCVALAGCGVWFYMRRQQNSMKNDIDNLLKQYLPLDAANSLAHPSTGAQADNLVPSGTTPSDL